MAVISPAAEAHHPRHLVEPQRQIVLPLPCQSITIARESPRSQ